MKIALLYSGLLRDWIRFPFDIPLRDLVGYWQLRL